MADDDSRRQVQLTEKGLQFALETAKGKYQSLKKHIDRDIKSALDILDESGPTDSRLAVIDTCLQHKFGDLHPIIQRIQELSTEPSVIQQIN